MCFTSSTIFTTYIFTLSSSSLCFCFLVYFPFVILISNSQTIVCYYPMSPSYQPSSLSPSILFYILCSTSTSLSPLISPPPSSSLTHTSLFPLPIWPPLLLTVSTQLQCQAMFVQISPTIFGQMSSSDGHLFLLSNTGRMPRGGRAPHVGKPY